jgi:hypothetical protein
VELVGVLIRCVMGVLAQAEHAAPLGGLQRVAQEGVDLLRLQRERGRLGVDLHTA